MVLKLVGVVWRMCHHLNPGINSGIHAHPSVIQSRLGDRKSPRDLSLLLCWFLISTVMKQEVHIDPVCVCQNTVEHS